LRRGRLFNPAPLRRLLFVTAPNFFEIEDETCHWARASYMASSLDARRGNSSLVDMNRLGVRIDEPAHFDLVSHPGFHFFLNGDQSVARRAQFNDEGRCQAQKTSQIVVG